MGVLAHLIKLNVSTTQIPNTFNRMFESCDDHINSTQDDTDGVSSFDFSITTPDISDITVSVRHMI
jgi:hypothetical protein